MIEHSADCLLQQLPGIRSRIVRNVNGLDMHVLEAGFETGNRPCVLLLHGFPEIAYSWRKVMAPIAAAGYHVIAPDQRGYGRTTGQTGACDDDLRSFRFFNLVKDALQLVFALGHRSVAAVIGHDFGSPVAACCALVRPDVFRSVVMMSAPFAGPAAPALGTGNAATKQGADAMPPADDIHAELAKQSPPRKHYQWYYSTREADADMRNCEQGLHDFLRAYFHVKSADCKSNKPFPLEQWSAQELARLPTYYVMHLDKNMAQTVEPSMPSKEAVDSCRWLPDSELAFYAAEFARTGFQGGLQWYRCATGGINAADLDLFAGRTIHVPASFIAGGSDWGVYQKPGDLERMQRSTCTQFLGCHSIEGAGHWVQQEQPEKLIPLFVAFLERATR